MCYLVLSLNEVELGFPNSLTKASRNVEHDLVPLSTSCTGDEI